MWYASVVAASGEDVCGTYTTSDCRAPQASTRRHRSRGEETGVARQWQRMSSVDTQSYGARRLVDTHSTVITPYGARLL